MNVDAVTLTLSDYLTVGEAASTLGVSRSTLRNWDKTGKLKAYRHPVNGYRLYSQAELESLLQEIRPEHQRQDRLP
jgi:excisionase family DNA binding protein